MTANHAIGSRPTTDSRPNVAIPNREPAMSIPYAGAAEAPEQATERQRKRRHQRDDEPHDERQHEEVRVGAGVVLEAEEDLVFRIDLDVQLRPQDKGHDAEQQQGEGRDRQRRRARPRRIPRPIPRKLAISTKLLK